MADAMLPKKDDKPTMNADGAWEIASSGTYTDVHAPRSVALVVLALALVMVMLPFVGMLWAQTESTSENRELAKAPTIVTDAGAFNWNVLSDAGTYFEDHFAYRNQLVAANAHIRGLFGTSSTDQVVLGSDGWLYYGGTLPDYLGQSTLTNRELNNIAHNLALAQGYVESNGAAFAFTLAPNKNTLYPGHMPYYYLASDAVSNAQRLKPLLDSAGVNYVDLFDVFATYDEEYYLKLDSHWDNRGALIAARALQDAVGRSCAIDGAAPVARTDFSGDLESMLYPYGARSDSNYYYEGINDEPGMSGSSWSYIQGEGVTDAFVVTRSAAGRGSLLMFRDSFGNALLPYAATLYGQGVFSKLIPYNLPTMLDCRAQVVVIERAERHLAYLVENPPIMPNPIVSSDAAEAARASSRVLPSNVATLTVEENGPYWMVQGVVERAYLEDATQVFIEVAPSEGAPVMLDAFLTSVPVDGGEVSSGQYAIDAGLASDGGYLVYVDKAQVNLSGATIRVYACVGDTFTCVGAFENLR